MPHHIVHSHLRLSCLIFIRFNFISNISIYYLHNPFIETQSIHLLISSSFNPFFNTFILCSNRKSFKVHLLNKSLLNQSTISSLNMFTKQTLTCSSFSFHLMIHMDTSWNSAFDFCPIDDSWLGWLLYFWYPSLKQMFINWNKKVEIFVEIKSEQNLMKNSNL